MAKKTSLNFGKQASPDQNTPDPTSDQEKKALFQGRLNDLFNEQNYFDRVFILISEDEKILRTEEFSNIIKRISSDLHINLITPTIDLNRSPTYKSIDYNWREESSFHKKEETSQQITWNDFDNRFRILEDKLERVKEDNEAILIENEKLKELAYTLSMTINENSQIQIMPFSIYVDTDDTQQIFSVYEATNNFIKVLELEKVLELRAQQGSWFKRGIAKTKEALTGEEVRNLLKKAEYALEVNTVLKQQSEIDKNQSESLLNIIKSLEGIPNAAVRIGSLLVLKITDRDTGETSVQVRTLTLLELQKVNNNPHLQNSPTKLLELLACPPENTLPTDLLGR